VAGVRSAGRDVPVPIVSQGCRPIGHPYIVTGAEGALITELGGRPPLQRLREIVEGLHTNHRWRTTRRNARLRATFQRQAGATVIAGALSFKGRHQ
jgi:small ligand-binding sensory domain FIST